MIRHFTATAIVLDNNQVLLLKHRKLGWWLPPGGHIETNEDPVQAVRREVREEVGLEVDIVTTQPFRHPDVGVVEPPFTILVEDIADPEIGDHQHIDLIYVCTPRGAAAQGAEYESHRWVPVNTVKELDVPRELPDLVAACAAFAGSLGTPHFPRPGTTP